MTIETALILSYANFLTKKRYDFLLQTFGSLEVALPVINKALLQKLGCKPETIADVFKRMHQFNVQNYQEFLQKKQIAFITIEDPAYPVLLKTIPDAPVFLYVQGNQKALHLPSIACIGTRAMSVYGKQVVQYIVPGLVRAGYGIVSGLALGIDAEVANVTLEHGGTTVAVLGNGLGSIFPKSNTKLAEQILVSGGALISEWPLNIVPQKFSYPARNRIVAGLCTATVVLEAGEGSGALITADLALDYNRDVFAVPGSIVQSTFAGSHARIASGQAQLITSSNDILEYYGKKPVQTSLQTYTPSSKEQSQVYAVLSSEPKTVESMVQELAVSTAFITTQLTLLELDQAAKHLGESLWVRV